MGLIEIVMTCYGGKSKFADGPTWGKHAQMKRRKIVTHRNMYTPWHRLCRNGPWPVQRIPYQIPSCMRQRSPPVPGRHCSSLPTISFPLILNHTSPSHSTWTFRCRLGFRWEGSQECLWILLLLCRLAHFLVLLETTNCLYIFNRVGILRFNQHHQGGHLAQIIPFSYTPSIPYTIPNLLWQPKYMHYCQYRHHFFSHQTYRCSPPLYPPTP